MVLSIFLIDIFENKNEKNRISFIKTNSEFFKLYIFFKMEMI